jgi:hypothetical protein
MKEQSGDKISEGQVICSRKSVDNPSYRKSLDSRNISASQQRDAHQWLIKGSHIKSVEFIDVPDVTEKDEETHEDQPYVYYY